MQHAHFSVQARSPTEPARHSPEAHPMADWQGEAAWGTSLQVKIGMLEYWVYIDILPLLRNVFKLKPSANFSTDQFDTIVLNLVEKIYFLC